MPQSSDPTRTVPTRRIAFDDALRDVPKHFAGDGDLITSHLVAALSGLFPDGEDFFVRSVRHFRDQVTDPDLARQVSGFIGQESMHGREHRVFNDRLAELGYPTKFVERFTRRGLELRTRLVSPKANLAATAAFEHVTATFAQLTLGNAEARRMLGHPAVAELFVWHALEESEHKAVAFDVYRAVGGTERMRVLTMKFLRYGFIGGTAVQVVLSLLGDRATFERGRLRASWARFRRTPIMQREVWLALCDYDRPDFHPDDHDVTDLVAQWRDRLFGAEGALNARLVPSHSAA